MKVDLIAPLNCLEQPASGRHAPPHRLPAPQPRPAPTRWDWLFKLIDEPEDDFECRRLRRRSACLGALCALLFGLAVFFAALALT